MSHGITFKEWLFNQEIMGFLTLMKLREDAALKGAADQNNMQFNQFFGISKNWFGIILNLVVQRVKGGESLDIAQKVATDLLMSMHQKSPTDKFYATMSELVKRGPTADTDITKFFTNAAAIRVRRYLTKRRGDMNVHMSSLESPDSRTQMAEPVDNTRPEDGSEESQIDYLRNAIQMELERMSAAANDVRTQKRLKLAKEVAAKRLENPPNFPTLDELLQMFPDVNKTMMFTILQDIQDAYSAVADSEGMGGISSAIEKRRNKKKKTG